MGLAVQRLLVDVLQFHGQTDAYKILKSYTYTIVWLVIVGRRLGRVVVTVTVIGLVTVVILVLMTLLVGGATISQ